MACGKGHLEIVKYLVEKGANVHIDDNYALKWAQRFEQKEIEEYLNKN